MGEDSTLIAAGTGKGKSTASTALGPGLKPGLLNLSREGRVCK